jgi:hypothetical protein
VDAPAYRVQVAARHFHPLDCRAHHGQPRGEPFHIGFWEGYRTMLPITMLMVLNSSITLLLVLLTQLWMLLIVAWFIDLFILRYFLEMDWYEVFLLNAVLGFFSCVTGGLL